MSQKLTNMSLNLPPLCLEFCIQVVTDSQLLCCLAAKLGLNFALGHSLLQREYKLLESHFARLQLTAPSIHPVTDAVLHRAQTRNFQATHTHHPPSAQKFLRSFFSLPPKVRETQIPRPLNVSN
jgi:hypothetical protein